MHEQLENRNLSEVRPLIPPKQAKAMLPTSATAAEVVLRTRRAIRDVLHGRDRRRLVVIVGPCSLHDPEVALDYAERLHRATAGSEADLVVLMRAYFEKPRTTVGWKGLINDPHLDGSCEVAEGLVMARQLLLRINEMGLPCATEVLDPVTPQYTADLLSWAAIGARTTESQTHREMASGLSMPVGFKNGTDGSLKVALDAMISASHPHSFVGINADGLTSVIKARGNPDRHLVLRGGGGSSNYGPAEVAHAAQAATGIARGVLVDCSHDNSGKDHTRQAPICREVLGQFQGGQNALMGLLIESNLRPGRQSWREGAPLEYGVSITDACIGWEETETLLGEITESVRMGVAA
jgi:3-deoxy-7-phosphoheptulonate synthase